MHPVGNVTGETANSTMEEDKMEAVKTTDKMEAVKTTKKGVAQKEEIITATVPGNTTVIDVLQNIYQEAVLHLA